MFHTVRFLLARNCVAAVIAAPASTMIKPLWVFIHIPTATLLGLACGNHWREAPRAEVALRCLGGNLKAAEAAIAKAEHAKPHFVTALVVADLELKERYASQQGLVACKRWDIIQVPFLVHL